MQRKVWIHKKIKSEDGGRDGAGKFGVNIDAISRLVTATLSLEMSGTSPRIFISARL